MTRSQNTLNGLRVLNTRPIDQGLALAETISLAGGFSIPFPALVISQTPTDWVNKIPTSRPIDKAIFISANAVRYFCRGCPNYQRVLSVSTQILSIGEATSLALRQQKISVHAVPIVSDSKHFLQLDELNAVKNQTILLVKGEGGRTLIAETLCLRGAHVIPVDVYRRNLPQIDKVKATHLWRDNAVDIIVFTSEQAIHNTFVLFGGDARPWLCNLPCVVISNRLAQVASLLGIQNILVSQHDSILQTLEHYTKGSFYDTKQ